MLSNKSCGFVLILFFLTSSYGFCQESNCVELEPIIINKDKAHRLKTYSLKISQIKQLNYISPIEALKVSPVDLQSRSPKGGIQTDFSLRGSGFEGVLILLDGQRINDPQTAHHNSDIPMTFEDLQAIEVSPGISSSLYGPDAIGGAINFVTRKPDEDEFVLESSFGSYNTMSNLMSITEANEDSGFRLSLENQESDGFYEDTDFKKFTSNVNSRLKIQDAQFNLNFGYQEKEFGAYDFYTPKSGFLSKEWTKTFLLNTGIELNKEGLLIKPNFLWRRHFDKFLLDKTLSRSLYLNHHRTDIYTPGMYLQKEMPVLGRLGLGLEYGDELINSTNLGKHSRQHKSVFFDYSKDFCENIGVGSSFRADDYEGFDRSYTGSISSKIKFREFNSVGFGISKSIRVPTFTELFYNDPTTSGSRGLSAEESITYQLGYDYLHGELSFGLTFFFRNEKDVIDWVKHQPLDAKWLAENISGQDTFGIENYLKLDINEHMNIALNYAYTDKHSQGGYIYKYGKNYARHLVNAALTFNPCFGTQSLIFNYKKKPDRDGYLLTDVRLSYKLNRNAELFFNCDNIFNVEYQEIEGIPQPGRWLEAGVRFEW